LSRNKTTRRNIYSDWDQTQKQEHKYALSICIVIVIVIVFLSLKLLADACKYLTKYLMYNMRVYIVSLDNRQTTNSRTDKQ